MDNYIALIIVVVVTLGVAIYAIKRRRDRRNRFRNETLPMKVHEALVIVTKDYDFSDVSIITSDIPDSIWGMYRGGVIALDKTFVKNTSVEKIASVLVHELAHHNGANEEEATRIGTEYYKKLMQD